MTPGIPILLVPRPGETTPPWVGAVENLRPTVLAAVLQEHSAFSIVMATGAMSGIDALSVGVVHGHNGLEVLAELEALHGENVNAPIIRTPDLRLCYLFQHRPGLGTEASVLPGIDVYGDDGVLTLPPSASATGEYSWFAGHSLADLPPPPWPAWLADVLAQESTADGGRRRGEGWSIEAARALYRRLGLAGLCQMGRDVGKGPS